MREGRKWRLGMQKQGVTEGWERIKSITVGVKTSMNVHNIGMIYGVYAIMCVLTIDG